MTVLLRRLRDREGFALVLALVTSVVLGIAGTSTVLYVSSNYKAAGNSKAEQTALSLAEAGLNEAFAVLHSASNPSMPSAVPASGWQPLDGGEYRAEGSLSGSTWTLTGTGRVVTSTRTVVRTVSGRARLGTSTRSSTNNGVWNYMYADSLTTCTTLVNSVAVSVPLYVRGDLCLINSSSVAGSAYSLHVGRTLSFANSAHVGTPESPLHDVHVGGGCSISGGPTHACSGSDPIYGPVDAAPAGFSKPPVNIPQWYEDAQPGPRHGCTSGSFPPGFDDDTTPLNATRTISIVTAQAYDCQVRDAQGNLLGRIAWTGGSSGTLTVAGTIFVDGNLELQNSITIVYQGRATLYVSGTVSLANTILICGVAGCGANWDNNTNLLAIVAGSSAGQATSVSFANSTTFQGAIYCVNDYSEGNSVTVWGPVIARQLYFQNSSVNHYVPIGTLMPAMPATYDTVLTVVNEDSSWG